jgi:tetratricopeptide (TPR) repeat protein
MRTPLNAIHRKEYARALIDLGNCYQIVFKEHDKAVEHLEQAQQQLILLKFSSTLGSSLDRDLARCNNILANSYSVLKQYDKADFLFAKSQEEHKRLAQLYPMNLEYITGQAHSHKYSAKSYYDRENYPKAIEQYLQAERIFLQVLQKENRLENVRGSLIDTQTEMGRCYLFTNDNDGALACFERLQENWLTYPSATPVRTACQTLRRHISRPSWLSKRRAAWIPNSAWCTTICPTTSWGWAECSFPRTV